MAMRFSLILFFTLTLTNNHYGWGFLPTNQRARSRSPRHATSFTARQQQQQQQQYLKPLHLLRQDEETTAIATNTTNTTSSSTTIAEEAMRWKKEAELMRLQAEKMDLSLTLQKIEALEAKLQNKAWLEKNPDKEAELQEQLQRLNDRLLLKTKQESTTTTTTRNNNESASSSNLQAATTKKETMMTTTESSFSERKTEPKKRTNSLEPKSKQPKIPQVPLAGFDDSDLELYIPVANDIIQLMPNNATLEEKLEAFRTAPELQEHFQAKIQKMLVGPLEEMQLLETLKQDYLGSTSSKEREQLKREIDRMEASIEDDGPIMYSDGFYCKDLKPLSEEEMALRMEAVGALPDILIAIYKQRNSLGESEDLRLAIQFDYYDLQLQLLEQVRFVDPLTDDLREEYSMGYNSLPPPVQDRFAKNIGLKAGASATDVIKQLLKDTTPLSPMMKVVEASNAQSEYPEYNDIEFVDRSRFLEEFIPSVGNMEGEHPAQEDVEEFAADILDKKSFMVSSKPERVAGGYYIRGTNLLPDDEDGGTLTSSDKLVEKVAKKLENSPLADKLEFFYILDPSPPTDEEIDFGPSERPLILVTSKNPKKLYSWASPFTKISITLSGVLSTFLFSVGTCALNPAISERFYATLDSASTTGNLDLQWFEGLCIPIFLSLMAIQLVHESAHRIVAMIYKFEIGLPNLIPSITTGLTGAITPLKSPPPNSKAMFDFAIAGPLAGLALSLVLLLSGLDMTTTMTLNSQLPVVPVDLVRSSSLGGGLVQYFLGNTAIMPDQGPTAVVQLHPLAIAGFIGCITNALALLPLGHTDGGRISVAMFGRRGAFVVKLFTTVILCVAGLVGLDEVNILLTYVLFASIWQRELETPARNEVDELDIQRGLVAISAAILVGLTLIPMF